MEMLAIGFLLLVGFLLFLEGLHFDIPKGYVYFAVGFALLIEITKMKTNKGRVNKPQDLRIPISSIKTERLIELNGKSKALISDL